MASNKFVSELARTEGAPTPENILAEIQEGLLEYLNNYEVILIRHSQDRRVSSGEYTAMNGVIEVSRKPEIRIVPDLTGSQLVYKQILDLNYTMFLCVSSEKNGIRILYHWQARGRHFMTSPYFDPKARGSVLCYKPVDITDGVNGVRPVAAVRKMLEEIGYRYDQFLWMMNGTQQKFEISDIKGELFWREGKMEGTVKLTDQKALRVLIKFEKL